MVKQLLAKLFILSALISGAIIANAQAVSLGYSFDYVFKPNNPQDFVNSFFWTVQAKCKIQAEDDDNIFQAEILSGSGKLNDNNLNKGDVIEMSVRNKDTLYITAPSGAKVRLTNIGTNEVVASCGLA